MKENCTLNAISMTSLNAPELELYSILNDSKVVHVWDAVLIRLLSQIFRVPYKIVTPLDDEYGRRLPDGNWSGMIGMVRRSEVDIAVGSIALVEELYQAVNFSYPYLFSDVTFMTDKLKPVSTNLALPYPFSLKLWILIMVTILTVSFIIFILENRKQAFHNILFMLFGSVMGMSINFKVRKITLRLLFSTWLIFIFVITNSYKGLLLSFLSFPPLTGIRNIRDLAEAAEQNSITCYTYKGHVFPQILEESEFEMWRSIGRCLKRNVITSGDPEELFFKAPPNKAFIGGRIFMMPFRKYFFISPESFFNVMYALPISRNFCQQKGLNKIMHRLFAAGLFSKHLKDENLQIEIKMPTIDETGSCDHKKLRITNLQGAFLVLIFGYTFASVVFLLEISIKYYLSILNISVSDC